MSSALSLCLVFAYMPDLPNLHELGKEMSITFCLKQAFYNKVMFNFRTHCDFHHQQGIIYLRNPIIQVN